MPSRSDTDPGPDPSEPKDYEARFDYLGGLARRALHIGLANNARLAMLTGYAPLEEQDFAASVGDARAARMWSERVAIMDSNTRVSIAEVELKRLREKADENKSELDRYRAKEERRTEAWTMFFAGRAWAVFAGLFALSVGVIGWLLTHPGLRP